jgi:hypothetical protein
MFLGYFIYSCEIETKVTQVEVKLELVVFYTDLNLNLNLTRNS